MPVRLAITAGEPAGIGPELLVQVCQQQHAAQLVAIADPGLLEQRAAQIGLPLHLLPWPTDSLDPAPAGSLFVQPVSLNKPSVAGQLDSANSSYVIASLAQAVDGCSAANFDAMVTAPVHKAVINDAGIGFSGHTEYLAERTASQRVVMMLATPALRVALVTTHLPLARVSAAITRNLLREVLQVLHHDLRRHFGLTQPRIMVCGLNPHAGEGGHMGTEEIDTIIPILQELRAAGMDLIGPVPADTAFTPARLATADVVLAMYHDQGLPVLKHQGFGEAINVTLGLPIIRTSVDHGTALDLAGSGKADPGSLLAAINYALQMVAQRANPHGNS